MPINEVRVIMHNITNDFNYHESILQNQQSRNECKKKTIHPKDRSCIINDCISFCRYEYLCANHYNQCRVMGVEYFKKKYIAIDSLFSKEHDNYINSIGEKAQKSKKKCTISRCYNVLKCKGVCNKHYNQLLYHGPHEFRKKYGTTNIMY